MDLSRRAGIGSAAATQLPEVNGSITTVETANTPLSAVRLVDGGVAQKPSLRQIDGFGNSWRRRVCRRRHVVRRVVLQACGHSVALGGQRELVVISARHPTVFATSARQTRIELRLQWFIR
jgi:poly(3-hydroxybutyrate) depolymerase